MTKVLLIGNGAREHAIAEKLVADESILYTVMNRKNPGIANIAKSYVISDLISFDKLEKYKDVDIAIVGPEGPLAHGVSDYLSDTFKIPVIGPRKICAQIETSKIFCRKLLSKYKVAGNPTFRICTTPEEIHQALEVDSLKVIKPDGLTGGKGVKIVGEHLTTTKEAKEYATKYLNQDKQVLLEEQLIGTEFTLQAFTDGKSLSFMPLVRDYKRAYDDDKGPNTGSMGSFSQSNHLLSNILPQNIDIAKKIMHQTIRAIHQETNCYFQGIIYGQFMQTENGVYLIEYNVRFGDPEAMNVLSLMESNLVDTAFDIVNQRLTQSRFRESATVCIYLVPTGYPENPSKNKPLQIQNLKRSSLFYASVYEENNVVYTTGSRALAILAEGKDVFTARDNAYSDINKITGDIRYRKDIALNAQD